jgi:hypothetical protein
MATKIIHKKSSVSSSVPVAGSLEPAEIAINLADKKIFSKTVDGTIIELADGSKLDGIEAGATADQTKADIDALGINADTVDGQHASAFALSVHTHTGVYEPADATILKDADIGSTVQAYSAVLAATTASFTTADNTKLGGIESGATADQTKADIDALNVDADTLDGQHASAFALSGHNHSGVYEPADGTILKDADIGVNVQAYSAILAGTTASFTSADNTKLDGIETGADVTDTANVTAAGALMDSEVTNLAQVKAFSSTDYATAAQGTLADSAVQPNDSPTFAGLTVDGVAIADDLKAVSNTPTLQLLSPNSSNGYQLLANVSDSVDGGISIQDVSESNAKRFNIANNGDISFYEDTGTTPKFFWDASAERLGIGTSSPSDLLDLSSSDPRIRLTNTGSGYCLVRTGGADASLILDADAGNTGSGSDIIMRVDGSEKMRITSAGDVGIGTGSPAGNLDVVDESSSVAINVRGATDTIIRARQTGNTGFGYFSFGRSEDIFVGGMGYDHNGDNMRFYANNTERMRINSSGSVGIGTTQPSAPLHINSASWSRIYLSCTDSDENGTSIMTNLSDDSGTFNVQTRNGDTNGFIANDYLILRNENGATSHHFRIANQDRMSIDSSGVVEIAEGSVVLNGSTISAIQVTVADNAVAQLTFTNRRFGMLSVVEGSDDDLFPDAALFFSGYADFGNSPYVTTAIAGSETVINSSNALTGTTGTDGKFTIGVAGTSGTLYLENRRGATRTFNVTLL